MQTATTEIRSNGKVNKENAVLKKPNSIYN